MTKQCQLNVALKGSKWLRIYTPHPVIMHLQMGHITIKLCSTIHYLNTDERIQILQFEKSKKKHQKGLAVFDAFKR